MRVWGKIQGRNRNADICGVVREVYYKRYKDKKKPQNMEGHKVKLDLDRRVHNFIDDKKVGNGMRLIPWRLYAIGHFRALLIHQA